MIQKLADQPAILSRMNALADPTRARALRVLERHELTVAELCDVLQLPQSTTSRHLKVLADEGWVVSRREGTAALYRMMLDDLEPAARRLWLLVREQLADSAAAAQDDRRTQRVLADRQSRSQQFFSSEAGQWDRHRRELFGNRFDLLAVPGLLDHRWTIADLGCGSGELAATLAPFVKAVIGIDASAAMIKAARDHLRRHENVQLKRGDLGSVPLDDASVDAATIVLVLHHLAQPAEALREAGRVLRPGGKLLIVDMLPHAHREYQQMMGHVWMGFSQEQLEPWLADAGLGDLRFVALPTEAQAKGPALFAASAGRAD
mgnify:CR=1 FL=1